MCASLWHPRKLIGILRFKKILIKYHKSSKLEGCFRDPSVYGSCSTMTKKNVKKLLH